MSLSALKERSKLRKQLIAQSLGVESPHNLSQALGSKHTQQQEQELPPPEADEVAAVSDKPPSPLPSPESPPKDAEPEAFVVARFSEAASTASAGSGGGKKNKTEDDKSVKGSESGDEKVVIDDYFKVLMEEEKIFRGSATFLKGTQSANPHNDYSQHYVDTGQRPQNFIRDPGLTERFEEYPKLKELIRLKDQLVATTSTPPMYLRTDDLHTFDLRSLGTRFDVILIEPPLHEQSGLTASGESWNWDMIEDLDIASVADSRCFIWLWCGSSPEGTERGRQCLRTWGFRRCEDITWVKTNRKSADQRMQQPEPGAVLHRTKEHCIMGIRGTVRRSLDGDFIHANVDIDLIISEEPGPGQERSKPEEMFMIIEHFCLGRRRLHLFGRDDTLRPGWLSVGPELASSNFDAKHYRSQFENAPGFTTGCTERIETLRPKSPERPGAKPNMQMDKKVGGMNRGRPAPLRRTESQRSRKTLAGSSQSRRTQSLASIRKLGGGRARRPSATQHHAKEQKRHSLQKARRHGRP